MNQYNMNNNNAFCKGWCPLYTHISFNSCLQPGSYLAKCFTSLLMSVKGKVPIMTWGDLITTGKVQSLSQLSIRKFFLMSSTNLLDLNLSFPPFPQYRQTEINNRTHLYVLIFFWRSWAFHEFSNTEQLFEVVTAIISILLMRK